MPNSSPSILLVTGSLDCGGAQRALSDMANYWAAQGWRVTMSTWSGRETPDFYPLASSISRIWFGDDARYGSPLATLKSTIRRIVGLRRWLRAAGADAVLSFIDVSNVLVLLATAGLGLRVVVCERTDPSVNRSISKPWKVLRRLVYRRASQVVAQTQAAARWIERECHVRVAVIPNALRPLKRLPCERELLVIGVGRLSGEKGFDLLLEAFAALPEEFTDWRLALLGDGPERQALTALSERLGIAARMSFVGEVRDVESWMARAGLVVQPSRREGFPNAVMEAMAMGAAIISTDCRSGPAELIRDGINGQLVPVDDRTALTQAMAELMRDKGARARLGREAERVAERYTADAVMSMWEATLLPAQSHLY